MFSKKLSSSVLSICDSGDLSYEAAAELCDLSSRYFGDIARGKTSPTVNTLEKLCNGLNRTPNELLGFSAAGEELSFRFPPAGYSLPPASLLQSFLRDFPGLPSLSLQSGARIPIFL